MKLILEPLYSADVKVLFCSKTQLQERGTLIKFSYSVILCSAYFKQGFLSKSLAPNCISSQGFNARTKAASDVGEAPLQFWADSGASSADGSCLTCSHSATWQTHGSQNNRLLSTKDSMCSPSGAASCIGAGPCPDEQKAVGFPLQALPALSGVWCWYTTAHNRSLISGKSCNPNFFASVKKKA